MTNFAIVSALEAAGIEVATTAVGDRYVLEALRERGFALGGEQSGHILELGFAPSGDGIASALLALEALGGRDLRERPRCQARQLDAVPAQVRLVKSVSEIGRLRMRFPVTAKIALHTAGATGGVPGSPMPPQRAPRLSVR